MPAASHFGPTLISRRSRFNPFKSVRRRNKSHFENESLPRQCSDRALRLDVRTFLRHSSLLTPSIAQIPCIVKGQQRLACLVEGVASLLSQNHTVPLTDRKVVAVARPGPAPTMPTSQPSLRLVINYLVHGAVRSRVGHRTVASAIIVNLPCILVGECEQYAFGTELVDECTPPISRRTRANQQAHRCHPHHAVHSVSVKVLPVEINEWSFR